MAMIVVSGVSRAFGTTRRSKAWPVKFALHAVYVSSSTVYTVRTPYEVTVHACNGVFVIRVRESNLESASTKNVFDHDNGTALLCKNLSNFIGRP